MGRRTRLIPGGDGWPGSAAQCLLVTIAAAGGAMIIAAGAISNAPAAGSLPDVEAVLHDAGVEPGIARFYEERAGDLIWTQRGRPTAAAISGLDALARADRTLGGAARRSPALETAWSEALSGRANGTVLARFDALLSAAVVRLVQETRKPEGLLVVDPAALAPAPSAGTILAQVAADPTDTAAIERLIRPHGDYAALEAALSVWRTRWKDLPEISIASGAATRPGQIDPRASRLRTRLGLDPRQGERMDPDLVARLRSFQIWHGLEPTGVLDDVAVEALNRPPGAFERQIQVNLRRLRALPPDQGVRYLKVNIAAAELSAVEGGIEVRRMPVIVGRPNMPTPEMAGMIRYAVLTPYWNIPMDLVRGQIAPAVQRGGREAFDARDLEALADWSPSPKRLEPDEIDWEAIAAGAARVRLRQKPGPRNMMGRAKFIFPNDVGIYLHDTPDKHLFGRERRFLSAGCVRVADAAWLGRWLLGRDLDEAASGRAEEKINLPRPVPVYLLYQTVTPRAGGGLVVHPDPYGRDALDPG